MSQFLPIPFAVAGGLVVKLIITNLAPQTSEVVTIALTLGVAVVLGWVWIASPLPNGTGFAGQTGEIDE